MAWKQLCNLQDLNDGAGREFEIEGLVVAVFRNGNEVNAVDGMCAHQGGPLAQGDVDSKCVTCPWHGWQYDITTGVNLLTGKKMIDCFPVEVREQVVWIDAQPAS